MKVVFQAVKKLCSISYSPWFTAQKMPYYAVARGRTPGIFPTWGDCEAQVKGFSGARYKKFNSEAEAKEYIIIHGGGPNGTTSTQKKPYSNNFTQNYHKRPFSSSTTTNQPYGSTANTQKSKTPTKKQNNSYDEYDDSESDLSDNSNESGMSDLSDGLDDILSKQMDDIESRLKDVEKNVDKIYNKGKQKQTIMIEPPQPKRKRKTVHNFEVDDDGFVQVYTDGACSANGTSGARAGLGVYWAESHPLNLSEPVAGRATNNCGEIQAATQAIKTAAKHGISKLTINTDSKFLINSVTKWLPGWKRNNWKLKSGQPVKNEIDFKDLDNVQNKLTIRWNYVEAHRGVYGNEKADQLAKAGAAMYRK